MGRRADGVDVGVLAEVSRDTPGPLELGYVAGLWNLTVSGTATTATLQLERSFDGGNTYVRYCVNGSPAGLAFPGSEVFFEPEQGVMWRVMVVSVAGGSVVARASR